VLDGRVDLAVHSAKDVPTDEDPRLAIAAFLPRADARDVLVLPRPGPASLADLAHGARVGTDSPRRTAFLRAVRPDLEVQPLHGNVDTRLRRLDAGRADALVLAAAGLERLGRTDRVSVVLEPEIVPPAPGQGALAVQVRSGDTATASAVRSLDDRPTRVAVEVERAILAGAGGGCRAPLGVLAEVDGDDVTVTAGYARVEADVVARSRRRHDARDPALLVEAVLDELAGVAAGGAMERGWPRVIVARPARQAAGTVLGLVDAGLAPHVVPAIAIEPTREGGLGTAVTRLGDYDWVVLASVNAARALDAAAREAGTALADVAGSDHGGPRWAVVGRATASALALAGIAEAFRPPAASEDAATLGAILPVEPGERVLIPRSALADDSLPAVLRSRGASVDVVTAYRTVVGPAAGADPLAAALDDGPQAIVAASPSAVRGLVLLAEGAGVADRLRELPIVAPGSTTERAARVAGFDTVFLAATPGAADIAAAAALALRPRQEIR
jgi:hydroxymethylbilane synthase